MKVQSGADTRNRTLGTVFSINCEEMPPSPTSVPVVYTHGHRGDGSVQRK